uniref:RING-type E3 ubiquitin transferase n=1 Tax=Tetraodon nigroviridis TaxID=99883 RepID=H3CBQ7_TETNG
MMEAGQRSPDSSSEECTVLEAPPPRNTCLRHAAKVAHLYCAACARALCEDCAAEHQDHPTLPLDQGLQQQRRRLQGALSSVQSRLPQVSEALSLVRELLQQLSAQRASMEEDIQSHFQDLHKQLDVRRSVLLMELEVTYGLKQKVLQAQVEHLVQAEQDMVSSCSRCQEVLEGEACVAGLQAEREVEEQLLQAAQRPASCQPEENHQLDLLMDTDALRKSVHNLGPSSPPVSAVASQSEAMGVGLEECLVGHPASVTVVTRDKSGGACKSGNAVLSAEVFTPDGSIVDGELVDHNNGTYEFVYVIPREGDFLGVRLYDQHIKGSPFRLKAAYATPSTGSSDGAKRRGKSPAQKKKASKRASSALGTPRRRTQNPIEDDLIFKIGSKGRNKGEFTNLQGVATATCSILIADSNNQCVQIFSNHGEFRNRFGVRGRSPGQLQRPTGVAVHPSGDIIIADYDNKWVSIFSCDGKFKAKLGSGRLLGPKGVSVDQNGHVIVVDNKACSVFVFQLSGKLVAKFGSRGNGIHAAGPHFAAVNKNNEIIVTDFHNHSVKVFSPDGELLLKFGSNGEGNGQFNAPTGVAVDDNGNIVVADWGNSRIQVFDGSGSFLSYINTSAEPLYGPQGLALTSDGHVVVADSGNHCFKVYRYLQ